SLDRLAIVPGRPYLGAAVVVLVADPAAAAVVVLVANDQALVVLVLVVIASHDLAARCLFGREVDFCANHRSLPSRMAGELLAAGRQLAGRADHDARVPSPSSTAIMSGRVPFAHSAPSWPRRPELLVIRAGPDGLACSGPASLTELARHGALGPASWARNGRLHPRWAGGYGLGVRAARGLDPGGRAAAWFGRRAV